ncbi:MAG TPA: hypothetical protein VGC06_33015 [Actinomycetes bacterium]
MPEGLSPIEVGKELNKHAKEGHEEAASTVAQRHSHAVQIGEAVLLSLVTIAAAWSGYAAAKWDTESRFEIARSATVRNLATRADLSALSTRNFDSSTFNAWFIAFTLDNPQKQAIAERRFRPEFKVAFDAWMATDPMHNPRAAPGPTYMPQYRLADQARADALDSAAEAATRAGDRAGRVGDDHIRITVFLAAILFLVGIGSTFKLYTIRFTLIVIGAALLVLATVLLVLQPGLPA